MTNSIKSQLANILGKKLPKTALGFCTRNGDAFFINRKGNFMIRKLNKLQIAQLKNEGLLGSLGWSLD